MTAGTKLPGRAASRVTGPLFRVKADFYGTERPLQYSYLCVSNMPGGSTCCENEINTCFLVSVPSE